MRRRPARPRRRRPRSVSLAGDDAVALAPQGIGQGQQRGVLLGAGQPGDHPRRHPGPRTVSSTEARRSSPAGWSVLVSDEATRVRRRTSRSRRPTSGRSRPGRPAAGSGPAGPARARPDRAQPQVAHLAGTQPAEAPAPPGAGAGRAARLSPSSPADRRAVAGGQDLGHDPVPRRRCRRPARARPARPATIIARAVLDVDVVAHRVERHVEQERLPGQVGPADLRDQALRLGQVLPGP